MSTVCQLVSLINYVVGTSVSYCVFITACDVVLVFLLRLVMLC